MARRQHKGLDRTDKRILEILQTRGRISNVELARLVNLSTTPCMERVRRLEREGVIASYVALVDPEKVGLPMAIFIEVKLDHTTPEAFGRFRETVAEVSELTECYMIAGEFDYLLKLQVADVAAYRRFMNEALPKLPDVLQTRSYIVVEQLKGGTALPLPA